LSKTIRIREHLFAEIERLAQNDRRSLVSQVELLLEQALRMPDRDEPEPSGVAGDPAPQSGEAAPEDVDEVRTDFK
jgi:hypothetical protein